MPNIVPAKRPEQSRATSVNLLRMHGITDEFALLGVRGYYLDSMGAKGKNDIGIYDDAMFLVTPTVYQSFNANCDPSTNVKGRAHLKPGVWKYRIGTHNITKEKSRQYKALVQAASVTVARYQVGDDTGWFGINIHRGSLTTTSSEGCQTIYPAQWDSFISLVELEMKRHNRATIPYVLYEHHN